MTSAPSAAPDEGATSPLYIGLRVFGLVVLLLMLVSIVYAGWISVANWSEIGV